MKKQMTLMDLGIVFVGVIAAIIVLSAVQRLNAPNLPAIQSSSPVISKDVEKSEAPAISGSAVEGTKQYSTVFTNPNTGQAEAIEYFAPSLSSIESEAAPEAAIAAEGQKAFRTVVVHPESGAQLYEWLAPSVSSASVAEEMATYSTVIVDKAAGQTEVIEWQAPRAR